MLYASFTKLRAVVTTSHNVGIHPGMPTTQLRVQQDITDAPPPPIEVPADNLRGVTLDAQPVVNRDQAETPYGEFHPPDHELPSNEEAHAANVSTGSTVMGRSNDHRNGTCELRPLQAQQFTT